jgi:hypothetical protein
MTNGPTESSSVPSLTVTSMSPLGPTSASVGMPVIVPLAELNVAQAGMPVIVNVSASLSASLDVGTYE